MPPGRLKKYKGSLNQCARSAARPAMTNGIKHQGVIANSGLHQAAGAANSATSGGLGASRAIFRPPGASAQDHKLGVNPALLRVVHGPGFADHRDLDLAGVHEFFFYGAGHVVGEHQGLLVGGLFRL